MSNIRVLSLIFIYDLILIVLIQYFELFYSFVLVVYFREVPDFQNLAGLESGPVKDIQEAGSARCQCIQNYC